MSHQSITLITDVYDATLLMGALSTEERHLIEKEAITLAEDVKRIRIALTKQISDQVNNPK